MAKELTDTEVDELQRSLHTRLFEKVITIIDARPKATFEQLTLIAMGWILEASCNQADPRLAKIQSALQDYVEAQVGTTPTDDQFTAMWQDLNNAFGRPDSDRDTPLIVQFAKAVWSLK